MKLKLSDQVIARMVDLLQIAILTGTDIVDNFRTLTLVPEDGLLIIHPDDNAAFVEAVNNLAAKAASLEKSDSYELT
jgi:hypothetical protein